MRKTLSEEEQAIVKQTQTAILVIASLYFLKGMYVPERRDPGADPHPFNPAEVAFDHAELFYDEAVKRGCDPATIASAFHGLS